MKIGSSPAVAMLLVGIATGANLTLAGSAAAGCSPGPTAGSDTLVCDSATAPDPSGTVDLLAGDDVVDISSGVYAGFQGGAGTKTLSISGGTIGGYVDTTGVTALTLTEGGSALITGPVTFGAGDDRLEVRSGEIQGHVEQGDGIDDLVMTAGLLHSLDQGGGLDTATISGGRIVGALNDGDFLTMTGGQVGSADLRVANNVVRMSGGTIEGILNAEQGADLLELSGGTIGGLVDFGNGNNTFVITGGSIGGGVASGSGTDSLTWTQAGTVTGAIDLATGADTATLRNLTFAQFEPTTLLDGGLDTDHLQIDGGQMSRASRLANWETVALTGGARFALDSDLVLGDAGSATGALDIDAASTLLATPASAQIRPFSDGQRVLVTNAGAIDLTGGASGPGGSMTIVGDYVGSGGRLLLRSVLASDGAPSDRLVLSGGFASGGTSIEVTNVGGAGALTSADGIMLVEAVNGASTALQAFSLAGGSISAGAYEYFLYRGGVSAGSEESWFLRSTLVPGSAAPAAAEESGAPDLPPAPPRGAAAVPLYRVEAPLYSAVPPLARSVALASLDTFHERRGEQALMDADGLAGAGWARLTGTRTQQTWSGDAEPGFDGEAGGVQAGLDLYGFESAGGRDVAGVFVGFSRLDGEIDGFALGREDLIVGDLRMDASSLGAYWTHVGASRWYVDAVVMGSWYDVETSSRRGLTLDAEGKGVAASLEAGVPVDVGGGLTLEPQAQAIWQRVSIGGVRDAASTVDIEDSEPWTGRIGARLYGAYRAGASQLLPYAKLNLWHDFAGTDRVVFGGSDALAIEREATALEFGAGLTALVAPGLALFAAANYAHGLGDAERHTLEANFGARLLW